MLILGLILFFSAEFPNSQADQIERLANWQIPPKKSGNNSHSTLSMNIMNKPPFTVVQFYKL